MDHLQIEGLKEILVPIFCGCILPIVAYWLYVRESTNKTNQRTQIVLAAIEKNLSSVEPAPLPMCYLHLPMCPFSPSKFRLASCYGCQRILAS